MEEVYIKVGECESDAEPIELPVEKDNTIVLSSVTAQFSGACGLKYRYQESQTMRGVKLVDGVFHLPTQNENWKEVLYIAVYPKDNKRKLEDDDTFRSKRVAQKCTDLIVLGLPWKVNETDLKAYFSTFGDLTVNLIKRDGAGKSKGYGFIRFGTFEAQQAVLKKKHMIEGRICDVKIPHSKEDGTAASPKIFVGRINESMTKDDIRGHFEQYGQVEDVYIPAPFRSFAFVTFNDPAVAQSLIGEDQVIKGVSVSINSANPKSSNRNQQQQHHNTTMMAANSNNNNYTMQQQYQQTYNHHHLQHQQQQTAFMPPPAPLPASTDPHQPSPANLNLMNPAVLAAAIGSWGQMVLSSHQQQSAGVPDHHHHQRMVSSQAHNHHNNHHHHQQRNMSLANQARDNGKWRPLAAANGGGDQKNGGGDPSWEGH